MVHKRYVLLPVVFMMTVLLALVNPFDTRAQNGDWNISDRPEILHRQITQEFPSFPIPQDDFNRRITGYSEYKILEITPRYYDNNGTEVSDLAQHVQTIGQQANNYRGNYLITNLKNFHVDTVTVKEFNSMRDDLAGEYDAIVFSAGIYSPAQNVCLVLPVENQGQRVKLYYPDNKRIKYDGYLNEKGEYHGEGIEYYNNQRVKYQGTYKNGKYHGYGIEYHQNGKFVNYEGFYKDGERACYGEEYENNWPTYRGNWENDNPSNLIEWVNDFLSELFGGLFGGNQNHVDSTMLENDLTSLKANEIIEDFVNKGLPVFIHKTALLDTNSVLYQTFSPLVGNGQVYMLDYRFTKTNGNAELSTVGNMMLMTELMALKPFVNVHAKPVDYLTSEQPITYSINDELTFDLYLSNKDQAELEIYFDITQNNTLEPFEMVHKQQIMRGQNLIRVNVPEVLPGPLSYRLVVSSGGFSQTIDGTILVGGIKQEINVLNIVSDTVFLLNQNGLFNNSRYQTADGYYDINITTCSPLFGDILPIFCNLSDMDRYDVILLEPNLFFINFSNSFHNKVLEQIENGKPVIFTSHVTRGKPLWYEKYRNYLGLTEKRTDSYTINQIDRLELINTNSYVTYPYNLMKEDLSIPKTLDFAFLNEKYQVDINQESLVPLINMYGNHPNKLDRFDTSNNYYYYKQKNVVYLGVGQQLLTPYTPLEHKFLLNAIINSHVENAGSERRLDERVVVHPVVNDFIHAFVDHKDPVAFTIEAWKIYTNTGSENLTYELSINDQHVETRSIAQNDTVMIDLTNKLPVPQQETVEAVTVNVVVKDSKGNQDSYSFRLFVTNIDDYVVFKQSIQGLDQGLFASVFKDYTIDYVVSSRAIDVSHLSGMTLPKTIQLNNLSYKAIFPSGIYINPKLPVNVPYDIVVLDNGQTHVTRQLGPVTYTLSSEYRYEPNVPTKSFQLALTPNQVGTVQIDGATIEVFGIGRDQDEVNVTPPIEFIVERFYLKEPQSFMILFKNQTVSFPEYVIQGNSEGYSVRFESTKPLVATVDEDGLITALSPGEATIIAKLIDPYGYTTGDELRVTVYVSEELSDHSGFVDDFNVVIDGETYMRLRSDYLYLLDDFVEIYPDSVYGVTLEFYVNGQKLTGSKHTFAITAPGAYYDLKVVIRQTDHTGTVIKEVEDQVKVVVHVDHEDDRH